MDCSNCSFLRRDFEEQKLQIVRYEAKIKDLVSAYKSLTTEKQSLEVALSLLSSDDGKSGGGQPNEDGGENEEGIALGTQGEGEKLSVVEQMEALKQAISTLTLVNKRKEMEFKKDRRLLVEAKDELLKRGNDMEQQLKLLKQQNKTQHLKQLRANLTESKEAYEKAMTEHGMVLAELQQQYSKEKKHAELLEKQITEMSQRLASKDELIKRVEVRLKLMGHLEQEIETLRKKAELTPTVRVIKDELINVKELSVFRTRNAINETQLREKDAERRGIELEAKVAESDQLRAKKALEKDNTLKTEEEEVSAMDRFRALYHELLKQQPDLDPIAALFHVASSPDPRRPLSSNSGVHSNILDYLGNSSSTPVPPFCSESPSRNESSASLNVLNTVEPPHAATNEENPCGFCLTSRKELDHFKSLIGHLQHKLGTLEENYERTKKQHDNAADVLRQRIIELENSQQRSFVQLTAEARQKVTELENELAKQRARIAEVIAEKDREIELTKNGLAAHHAFSDAHFCPAEAVPNLPMDPRPNDSSTSATPSLSGRTNSECRVRGPNCGRPRNAGISKRRDTGQSIGEMDDRRPSVGEEGAVEALTQTNFSVNSAPMGENASTSAGTAARNIFYEQELSKGGQEIGELRNIIRLLELKMRDIEQAMLMKDVQYLQIIETLKEEIRVLEGRLTLASSQTNMAYLRNIFVQFVGQGSVIGRRHILKAIGAVLQLTPAEMRRVDRWSH
uniref:GRIP domain-containing protein n=1 Tax=Globodera rostochiensis TaxID=31243 RepID=A0A914HF02_GLORO